MDAVNIAGLKISPLAALDDIMIGKEISIRRLLRMQHGNDSIRTYLHEIAELFD